MVKDIKRTKINYFIDALKDRYRNGIKVLDYGYGKGDLYYVLKDNFNHFDYCGLEINGSENIDSNFISKSKLGLIGSKEEKEFIDKSDVVILISIFTHLEFSDFEKICSKFKGKYIIFSTFIDDRYRVEGPKLYGLDNCYRFVFYTDRMIKDYADRNGYSVKRISKFYIQHVDLYQHVYAMECNMRTVPTKFDYGKKQVKKEYTILPEYRKNFKSAMEVMKTFDSKYKINIWDVHENGYTMERMDFALGNGKSINKDTISRIFFSISIDELLEMLDDLLSQLKSFGIRHKDINPGNILWSENQKTIKLIDFFWSDFEHEKVDNPDYMNPNYGIDDEKAIERIKEELYLYYYQEIDPKIKIAMDFFDENVGVGEYKDGSSTSKGKAYHIIDIPPFDKQIPYVKDMCVSEYQRIKENMPIKPKSFIDIGCANGYFTFNLLRDYNIDSACVFEADPAVREFIKIIKTIYNLKELKISGKFNHKKSFDKKYDITIWLNSHMWVYKQLGRDKTLKSVQNVINHSKYMFFQTAGGYSKSKYKVEEYKSKEDVRDMLLDAGAVSVDFIGSSVGVHWKPRDMFLVKGRS